MKSSCHDCLWRDFAPETGACKYPEKRTPKDDSFVCEEWEWRYN